MSYSTIKSDSRLITIDSKYPDEKLNDTYNSAIRFSFDTIDIPQNHCMLISLVCFNAYNSLFNVNEYSNTLVYSIGGTHSSISLPYANYNMKTMANYLNLNTPFSVDYNAAELSFTFSASDDFIIKAESSLNGILGFAENTDTNSSDKALTTPYPCNFAGPNSICFNVKNVIFNNSGITGGTYGSLLANIPVRDKNVIRYAGNGYRTMFNSASLCELLIEIRDDHNNLVNFHNKDWNATIQIDFVDLLEGANVNEHSMKQFTNSIIKNILFTSQAEY